MQNARRKIVTIERVRGVASLPPMYCIRPRNPSGKATWFVQDEVPSFRGASTKALVESIAQPQRDEPEWRVVSILDGSDEKAQDKQRSQRQVDRRSDQNGAHQFC